MDRSALCIVLHAHLPWVRHPELPFYMEEHWLFEAIAETYLPMIEVLRGLEHDRVPASIAIDVSPPLASMLCDELLRDRSRAAQREQLHARRGAAAQLERVAQR